MQQQIDKREKRWETLENVAASKEEAAAIAKNEIQSEDTAKIIEENVEKKLQEQPITGKMTTLQTVQEYMSDLSEVDKRSISFLTHKLPESTAEKKVEQENEDKNQIKEILKHINLNLPEDTVSKTTRLGQNIKIITDHCLFNSTTRKIPAQSLKIVKKLKDSRW